MASVDDNKMDQAMALLNMNKTRIIINIQCQSQQVSKASFGTSSHQCSTCRADNCI